MNKIATTLGLVAGLALPALALAPDAQARPVTLTAQLRSYGGNGAYVAIYLTDAQGKFHSTLRVAGSKAKYYPHLRDWARGHAGETARIDGVTGASVGSGQTLKVTVEIADALIFLASSDASWISGADIPIDGGLSSMVFRNYIAPAMAVTAQ